MNDQPQIYQINISQGGVPKKPQPSAQVMPLGLSGDLHDNTEHHGGPEKAISLYSLEIIRALQDTGQPIVPASTGNNRKIFALYILHAVCSKLFVLHKLVNLHEVRVLDVERRDQLLFESSKQHRVANNVGEQDFHRNYLVIQFGMPADVHRAKRAASAAFDNCKPRTNFFIHSNATALCSTAALSRRKLSVLICTLPYQTGVRHALPGKK